MKVKIKCEVVNKIGFSSFLTTEIFLQTKDGANEYSDLHNLDSNTIYDESSAMQQLLSIYLIAQKMGNLNETIQYFDPTIEKSECTNNICNLNGKCLYLATRKKHYCNCTEGFAGQNCTFNNQTELAIIRDKAKAVIT